MMAHHTIHQHCNAYSPLWTEQIEDFKDVTLDTVPSELHREGVGQNHAILEFLSR